ncbi:polysaccharide pyruvyl transferase family protein [Dysgonomonas sp. ZJ709]|uniref:polysaccharide pyruvyl transferase family protein n=1 Tax=Dysgonomonas sp. ZJ709 TaxID=2709797 RepID=UPI0013EAAA0A|nr:polysaccharide pyruvyl transferase family protein [Dysgonomonas sp. ZJ709]
MKIGILTLPISTNYGGILQAYALQMVLKKMGHDTWLINRRRTPISSRYYIIEKSKQCIKKCLFGSGWPVLSEKERILQEQMTSQYTRPFIEKNIQPQTIVYDTSDKLRMVTDYKFDAYVVGSDQVWRPEYTSCIYDFFLGFLRETESAKRISYAASFGLETWAFTPKQTKKCKCLSKLFTAISVREAAAVSMCEKYFGVNAVHVLDPTMLLSDKDYLQLLSCIETKSDSGGLLSYILDRTELKNSVVEKISNTFGYQSFEVNSRTEDVYATLEDRIAPPVENWIRGFFNAKYVITDSFHACVFAILFNKPFIVYGNRDRGMVRFTSLLSKFNLEDRLITSLGELTEDKITRHIEWSEVNDILNKERAFSLSFLSQSLTN